MSKTLFLLCILALPFATWAQANQASWSDLSALRPGQTIQIIEVTSKKHTGIFEAVSDTALSYRETAGERSIQKQDIRSVKLTDNKRRKRHTLIGLAIGGGAGAGVGAGIGAATYKGCPSQGFCLDILSRGEEAAIGAVIGLAAGAITGAVVGAVSSAQITVYSTSPH